MLREHKDTVVNTVLHVKDTLGLTKAFRVFRLSRSTFDRWLYSGLRATRPNEYWHADITYYRILDQQRYYIYLVMDNFSRYNLDYYVADRIDGGLRMESLRRAYAYALTVTTDLDVHLIEDGGPENVNKVVDRFLQQSDITRQVALRDISFSNLISECRK